VKSKHQSQPSALANNGSEHTITIIIYTAYIINMKTRMGENETLAQLSHLCGAIDNMA